MRAAVVDVLLLLPLRVHACVRVCMRVCWKRRSQEHGVIHEYTSVFAKRRFTYIYKGVNDGETGQ